MKDNFSEGSHEYQLFRPTYPNTLIKQIATLTNDKNRALDCATGNGQIATQLTGFFREVYATDISRRQLDYAAKSPQIKYSLQAAEQMNFPDLFFDLITVGQAAHWFDQKKFFQESSRVLKPGGILALVGYQLLRFDSEIDDVLDDYNKNIVGKYWDPERQHVDNRYAEIQLPYQEILINHSDIHLSWSLDELLGYLSTWSAYKHFIQENKYNPINNLKIQLQNHWGPKIKRKVRFPVFTKIGRKP